MIEIVPLTAGHLDKLPLPEGLDIRAYFSSGSTSYCLLSDGDPVFAGGIVNLQWRRGEAWMLPTSFFRSHLKTCWRAIHTALPELAASFVRVQATCVAGTSAQFLRHLGFSYEGKMAKFGPNGETCTMYARIFP